MTDLSFAVTGAAADPTALVPTIVLRLRIATGTGPPVQSLLLRCQVRVEPAQRRYGPAEQERLRDLFGEPWRWADTAQPFLWLQVTTTVGRIDGACEVDLPLASSYDLEVAAGKYLEALEDGEVPLLLLFNGTAFTQGPAGLRAEPIPWDREARFRLPVAIRRDAVDAAFPGSGWLRLRRDTIDALLVHKARSGAATFDDTVLDLLAGAEVDA